MMQPFSIFNGVFEAVHEFITVREPDKLVFATKRDELASIYQTYLRRESAALDELGYKLEGPHRVDPCLEFVLRRKKPSGWKSWGRRADEHSAVTHMQAQPFQQRVGIRVPAHKHPI